MVIGPDGRDTLADIESLMFDDAALPIADYANVIGNMEVDAKLNTIFDPTLCVGFNTYHSDLNIDLLSENVPASVSVPLADGGYVAVMMGHEFPAGLHPNCR